MKLRAGFVSNSSSGSFSIPSKLLTVEQKEMLLSLDNWKKQRAELHAKVKPGTKITITSENNYPRSKEYHKIYQKMLCDNQVHDSWMVDERRHYDEEFYWIGGATSMDNGSVNYLPHKGGGL